MERAVSVPARASVPLAATPARSAPRPARQLALAFEEPPRWGLEALQRAVARAAGRPVSLTLTENRSVLLSFRRQADGVRLRLHRMFLHAPNSVVAALGRHLNRRSRRSDGEVRRFMNENLHRVRSAPRQLPPLQPGGRCYDLRSVFAALNARFFAGGLQVPITWGRGRGGRARRGGLTFGSYDPVLRLIRIHPVLDRRDVPLYFLESVVYHEMLHHHMGGVPDRVGRTVYHTRAFREAERRFPQHAQVLEWEKQHLAWLIRASQALERERRSAPRA